MDKKTYLLPYSCQKLGWWMLGASLVGYLIFGIFEIIGYLCDWGPTEIPQVASYIMVFLVTCLPFLGLIMISLSQEKIEDEYIQSLRARSLFIVAVYAFLICMIKMSLTQFLVAYINEATWREVSNYINLITNIPLMAVLYLLLFKGSMIVDYLRSKRNGE